jgi:DNA uptake protein ComE-like DNA-binding protein
MSLLGRPRFQCCAPLVLILLAAGCGSGEPGEEEQGVTAQELSERERVAVLDVVNSASLEELDVAAALDRRAAENIVAHRDGGDALLGSGDDDPFDTIEELDAVKYVGDATLAKLVAYAESLGLLDDEPGRTPAEIAAILAVANDTTFTTLDEAVGLDRRAAENIVAHREGPDATPGTADDDRFDTLEELDAVAYVGESALGKLLSYAQSNGMAGPPCLIISEYLESSAYNDAVELYNCGASPIEQSEMGICLVRNDDLSCSVTAKLDAGMLAPGEVWELCRTNESVSWLPSIRIAENCRQVAPGVMTLSGDDRLLVFHDLDGDGAFGAAHDRPLDAFGVIAERPPSEWWKDIDLRRCNLQPFDGFEGGPFERWDYFVEYQHGMTEHYGVPPSPGACP